MALGEFSPAFGGGRPDDLVEIQTAEARLLETYSRPTNLRITEIEIPGSARNIPARIYQPTDEFGNLIQGPLPIMVWFHGGAYVFGDYNMGEAEFTSCEVADRGHVVVLNVDYQLADENRRLPCSQVDGFDAVRWALDNAANWNANPNQLFVGGASAGAMLTGSVALMLRDSNIQVAGLLPIYPAAHAIFPPMDQELARAVEGIFYFTPEFAAAHNPWLIEGMTQEQKDSYYPFAGDAKNLAGQAPFFMVHAQRDSLRASGEQWTRDLRAAGNSVEEYVEPGAVHGYLSMGPTQADADHTFQIMADWINKTASPSAL